MKSRVDTQKVADLSNTTLNQAEITELLEILSKLDTDTPGEVSLKEASKVLLEHEKGRAYMEVLIIADQDDSGSVDIPELMAAIINLNAIITLQQQKEIFEQFDDDKSASLDLKEVHLLFKSKLLKKYVPKH